MRTHGTTSHFGNQPLGPDGTGLNVGIERYGLGAEIAAAVAEAAKAGNVSRKDIFDRFAGRGVRSCIYDHIANALKKSPGLKLAPTKPPPASGPASLVLSQQAQAAAMAEAAPLLRKAERLAGVPEAKAAKAKAAPEVASAAAAPPPPEPVDDPPAEPVAAAERFTPALPPPQAAAGDDALPRPAGPLSSPPASTLPTDRPIDLPQRIAESLGTIDELMRMARTPGGQIRNPRLAIVTIDLLGKTAERLQRISSSLDEQSQISAFMRQIVDAILQESPDVRARILGRLRTIAPSWGL